MPTHRPITSKRTVNRLKTIGITAAFVAGAVVIALAAWPASGHAADKGGPKFDDIIPQTKTWTGCGVSGNLGWMIGTMDSSSPITIGSEGAKAGVGAFCDWQIAKHFVGGLFINYDWAMGDLSTIGINTDLSYGARLGVPLNGTVMPYIGGAKSHIDVEGLGRVDGYKAMAGLEVRLATELPAYLAVEASRGFYENVGGFGFDANTTEITGRLRVKLQK